MVEIGCLGTHTAAWHGRVAGQLIPTPITHWVLWGHWIESARLSAGLLGQKRACLGTQRVRRAVVRKVNSFGAQRKLPAAGHWHAVIKQHHTS